MKHTTKLLVLLAAIAGVLGITGASWAYWTTSGSGSASVRCCSFDWELYQDCQTDDTGKLVTYDVPDISEDMSFLEMLDILNDRLLAKGEEPIAFVDLLPPEGGPSSASSLAPEYRSG